ncbi:hypothetical protein F3Y22_tig00000477pilonHSYRG00067 [Hibiscus syriacus]|uniref:RNase H type-1 domain-containing protein n=1 Tax=Hibiscus syriacus TaxID=106335 RepID=A0A6A3D0S6_HIBSY|nr:hypothetical protein F3Y22_tig00000477pilonHSYRG00067 [Hibiscus syriacus]
MGVMPPNSTRGEDCCVWQLTPSHQFIVDSTYCFFIAPLSDWIMVNLSSKANLPGMTISWAVFFPTFIWQIWKRRNCFVFNDTSSSMNEVLRLSISWSKHFEVSHSNVALPSTRHPTLFMWRPPMHISICLNVDAAVDFCTGLASIWAVLRASDGAWLCGFHKFLRISSPLMAELRGIYLGLINAWDCGFEALQIQTDSHQSFQLLLDPTDVYTTIPLVRAINLIRVHSWYTNLLWVPREENMVADGMAKLDLPRNYSMHLFPTAPASVH